MDVMMRQLNVRVPMMAKSRRKLKRPNVPLHDVEFVKKDLTAEFEVPELQKMSYSRRIILLKGIGVFKSRKRTPTSTNSFFENSLPQQRLLARKRRRLCKSAMRPKPTGNKLSSIVFFIYLIILLLQIIHSCDLRETLAENESLQLGQIADLRRRAQSYLAHVYRYAEKPLKLFREQLVARLTGKYVDPEAEHILLTSKPYIDLETKRSKQKNTNFDKQMEGSLNSGGTGGANRLINAAVFNNRFTSAKLFKCLSTRVESNPKIVKPVGNENVACIVSAPRGGDAGITCTSKLLCCLSGGRPISPCTLGKIGYINDYPVRAFDGTRKNCWKQYLAGGFSNCILSDKTRSRLLELVSRPICKLRLTFMSLSIIRPTSGYCMESPNSGPAMVVPIVCNGDDGINLNLDLLSSPVTAKDAQRLFNFLAGADVISWSVVILPCRSFYLVGNATRRINNQSYTVCFRTELISEKRAEKMNLPVQLASDDGSDDFFVIKTSTNVAAAFAVIQSDIAAVATAPADD